MKTRIISAVIGLPILGVLLFFYDTIAFNIAIALVCVIGVYEMLHSTKYVSNLAILIVSLIYAAAVPFFNIDFLQGKLVMLTGILVVVYLCILFAKHQTIQFEQVAIAFTASVLVPFALSSFVFVRDAHPNVGLYYILLIFMCAWISDAGAYFIGRVFGKHKLAPNISPKKTIEGAIGGIFFCLVFNIAYTYIYMVIMENMGVKVEANLIILLIISIIGSLIGIFGDLSASIIKRQTGIKDFGNIIPGHGGIVDRFDSVLFIAPFLYLISEVFPIISIVTTSIKID
jgi:phosphatidate cytidylyltransferase